MIAWPTNEQEKVRARIARHRELDEIVQGIGFQGGKGCAIGCSLDRYDHFEYVRVVGVDIRTARTIDWLHERLPAEIALDWPGRVAAALNPGADTTLIMDRLLLWALQNWGKGNVHLETAASLYARRCSADEPTEEQWRETRELANIAYLDALDARRCSADEPTEEQWRETRELANRAYLDALAALDALDARDARAALAALDALDALAARDALDALAARAALAARDALDALDARARELADQLIEIMRSCPKA